MHLARALVADRTRLALEKLALRQRIAAIGMTEVVSARQSPSQIPFAERVIGSIRRECTDHGSARSEDHLRSVIRKYVVHHSRAKSRTATEPSTQ